MIDQKKEIDEVLALAPKGASHIVSLQAGRFKRGEQALWDAFFRVSPMKKICPKAKALLEKRGINYKLAL